MSAVRGPDWLQQAAGQRSRGHCRKHWYDHRHSVNATSIFCRLLTTHACTGITSLRLGAVTKLGDSALLRVAARLAGLEELDLTHCPRITDRSATQLFDRCPQLKTLSLGGKRSPLLSVVFAFLTMQCPQAAGRSATLHSRASSCRSTWSISMWPYHPLATQVSRLSRGPARSSNISTSRVLPIETGCQHVQVCSRAASSTGCANITDEAFLDDTPFGEHLETLNLAGCSNITARGRPPSLSTLSALYSSRRACFVRRYHWPLLRPDFGARKSAHTPLAANTDRRRVHLHHQPAAARRVVEHRYIHTCPPCTVYHSIRPLFS